MERAASNRVKRVVTASAVILAHVVLVWLIAVAHMPQVNEATLLPIIATIIDQPQPRNLPFGPAPINVKNEDVVHLQRLAPKIPEIPVDDPVPPPTVADIVPVQISTPIAQAADAGLNGNARESTSPSRGGNMLTLLRRVIPKYPASASRNRQEGSTTLQLRVDEGGRVKEVKVARSSGFASLDTAAVQAARRWKFAKLPAGSAPHGAWAQTELRFVHYRFVYSLIGDNAADGLHSEEQVKGGVADAEEPGTEEAFKRFIAAVSAGTFTGNPDPEARAEVTKMRAALAEWGEVRSIQFTGAPGTSRWMSYPVQSTAPQVRRIRPTVEVTWSMFEVRHEHGISEWLVAVDRDGVIWNARASPAPWM